MSRVLVWGSRFRPRVLAVVRVQGWGRLWGLGLRVWECSFGFGVFRMWV